MSNEQSMRTWLENESSYDKYESHGNQSNFDSHLSRNNKAIQPTDLNHILKTSRIIWIRHMEHAHLPESFPDSTNDYPC